MKAMPAAAACWTFLRGFLRSPRQVGSIVPSSPWLVRALVGAAPVEQAKVVVEFGPGTGVMTGEILRRLPADARLIAFEVDEHFAANLRARITDPRATILAASAVDAVEHLTRLGITSADCIISSLPLTSLPRPLAERILETTAKLLRPGGVFVTYQFSLIARSLLHRHFPKTRAEKVVLRNLPPAIVFVCSPRGEFSFAAQNQPAPRAGEIRA
jgi:phospholipid N-methyltransferase